MSAALAAGVEVVPPPTYLRRGSASTNAPVAGSSAAEARPRLLWIPFANATLARWDACVELALEAKSALSFRLGTKTRVAAPGFGIHTECMRTLSQLPLAV